MLRVDMRALYSEPRGWISPFDILGSPWEFRDPAAPALGCPIIADRRISLPAACQSVLLSLINEKISSQQADPSES